MRVCRRIHFGPRTTRLPNNLEPLDSLRPVSPAPKPGHSPDDPTVQQKDGATHPCSGGGTDAAAARWQHVRRGCQYCRTQDNGIGLQGSSQGGDSAGGSWSLSVTHCKQSCLLWFALLVLCTIVGCTYCSYTYYVIALQLLLFCILFHCAFTIKNISNFKSGVSCVCVRHKNILSCPWTTQQPTFHM